MTESTKRYREKMVQASHNLRGFYTAYDQFLMILIESIEKLSTEQLKNRPELNRISQARSNINQELKIIEESLQRLYRADTSQQKALIGIGTAGGNLLDKEEPLLDQVHDLAELATLAHYPEYAIQSSPAYWVELLAAVELPALQEAAGKLDLNRLNEVAAVLQAAAQRRQETLSRGDHDVI